LSKGKIR